MVPSGPPQGGPRQQVQAPKWTLADTQEITCSVCGNKTFREAMYLRKVSKLITGEPKDTMLNIPVLACDKCGYALQDLLPNELKDSPESPESV